MHQLRKDPVLSRWVAVLSESMGPEDYPRRSKPEDEDSCLLCAGREAEAPPEMASIIAEGTESWSARVIQNTRPVLIQGADLGRRGLGMYDAMHSVGANELIVETPGHDKTPEDMGAAHVRHVLELYRQRFLELQKDERMRYILICKNSGPEAGAIIQHPHSEIIATPIIPLRIKAELDGAKDYFEYKERCVFCDILDEELRVKERIVEETEHYVAFCPYAPKFPFEFWIMPKTHRCAFESTPPGELDALSETLSSAIRRMRRVLGEPSYNYVLHSAPNRIPRRDYWHTLGDDYHWHIEVVPRLQRASGFEWGSGFYVVSTSPEYAARHLRDA